MLPRWPSVRRPRRRIAASDPRQRPPRRGCALPRRQQRPPRRRRSDPPCFCSAGLGSSGRGNDPLLPMHLQVRGRRGQRGAAIAGAPRLLCGMPGRAGREAGQSHPRHLVTTQRNIPGPSRGRRLGRRRLTILWRRSPPPLTSQERIRWNSLARDSYSLPRGGPRRPALRPRHRRRPSARLSCRRAPGEAAVGGEGPGRREEGSPRPRGRVSSTRGGGHGRVRLALGAPLTLPRPLRRTQQAGETGEQVPSKLPTGQLLEAPRRAALCPPGPGPGVLKTV